MAKAATRMELRLKILNASKLADFLKKFTIIDSNAMFEIVAEEKITVKGHTPSRTAMKVGEISFADVFENLGDTPLDYNICVGIFNLDKLAKILYKYNGKDDVEFVLYYEKSTDAKDKAMGDYFGKKYVIKDTHSSVDNTCATKSLFKYLPDSIVNSVFNTDSAYFKFVVDDSIISDIAFFSSLEATTEIKIEMVNDQILFSGKNFKRKFDCECEMLNETDDVFVLNKTFLKNIDKETYIVYANESGLLLYTEDGSMKISLGRSSGEEEDAPEMD